jgi:hypothetical protein
VFGFIIYLSYNIYFFHNIDLWISFLFSFIIFYFVYIFLLLSRLPSNFWFYYSREQCLLSLIYGLRSMYCIRSFFIWFLFIRSCLHKMGRKKNSETIFHRIKKICGRDRKIVNNNLILKKFKSQIKNIIRRSLICETNILYFLNEKNSFISK